jgi:Family of unknown function (DUF6498)
MAAVPSSRSVADRAGTLTGWLLFGINVGFALYALLQDYGYAMVLMVYLGETAIVGALNVPKMLLVALFGERIDSFKRLQQAGSRFALTFMLLIGYSAGVAVVCLLLYMAMVIVPVMLEHGDKVSHLQSQRTVATMGTDLRWPIAALALSHVVSFFVNFLWRGEFRGASLLGFAVQPVLRVAGIVSVMLLALAVALLQPWAARTDVFAVVVIAAKILVDWKAHQAERRRLQALPAGGS